MEEGVGRIERAREVKDTTRKPIESTNMGIQGLTETDRQPESMHGTDLAPRCIFNKIHSFVLLWDL